MGQFGDLHTAFLASDEALRVDEKISLQIASSNGDVDSENPVEKVFIHLAGESRHKLHTCPKHLLPTLPMQIDRTDSHLHPNSAIRDTGTARRDLVLVTRPVAIGMRVCARGLVVVCLLDAKNRLTNSSHAIITHSRGPSQQSRRRRRRRQSSTNTYRTAPCFLARLEVSLQYLSPPKLLSLSGSHSYHRGGKPSTKSNTPQNERAREN